MALPRPWLLSSLALATAAAASLPSCVSDVPAGPDAGGDSGAPLPDAGDAAVDTGTGTDAAADAAADADAGCSIPDAGPPGTVDPGFQFTNSNNGATSASFGPNAVHVDANGIYVAGTLANSNACATVSGKYDLGLYVFTTMGAMNTTVHPTMQPVCVHYDDADGGYSVTTDSKGNVLVGALAWSNANGLHATLTRWKIGLGGAMLDTNFHSTGKIDFKTDFPIAGLGAIHGLATDANDNVYFVGSTGGQGNAMTKGFVGRVKSDGTLDGGFPVVSDASVTGFYGVSVDGAGVTVSGTTTGGAYVMKRYTLSGGPDTTWGASGVTQFPGSTDQGKALLRLPDGRYAMGGATSPGAQGGPLRVAFAKPSGGADTTVNGNGVADVAALKFDPYYMNRSIGALCDGQILIAGRHDDADGGQDIGLLLVKTDGTQDLGFGVGGIFRSNRAGDDIPVAAVQEPTTGKIIVIGRDGGGHLLMYRVRP